MSQPETQVCQPSLLGLPSELRMKIFEQFFADEVICVEEYDIVTKNYFLLAALSTCQLIHHEAKQALRQRLSECELHYRVDQPVFEDTVMLQDSDLIRHQYMFSFLQQYGELISRVRVREDYYDEAMHLWMLNLRKLSSMTSLSMLGTASKVISTSQVS